MAGIIFPRMNDNVTGGWDRKMLDIKSIFSINWNLPEESRYFFPSKYRQLIAVKDE